MKAVVIYELGNPAPMDKIRAVFPRHRILIDSFAKLGKVIAIGTFADISEGAMGIFRDKECAEEFTRQDPFILEGLIEKVTIKEWNEILLG